MTAHVTPLQWEKPLLLDRQSLSIIEIPYQQQDSIKVKIESPSAPSLKNSFLYSKKLKEDLLESRKAFLQLQNDEKQSPYSEQTNSVKKTPTKKISFKIKKTSSIYRRNPILVHNHQKTPTNKVSELAMKFNGMISEKNSILEQPKFRKLVKRANSQRSGEISELLVQKKNSVGVTRKPSVKTKPILDDKDLLIIRRRTLQRKASGSDSSNKMCVRAKIGYLETPQTPRTEEVPPVHLPPPPRPKTLPILPKIPPKPKTISPTSGSVRATIEIFERRKSESSSPSPPGTTQNNNNIEIVPKPELPERKPLLKTEQNEEIEEDTDKTDFEQVQIFNIPAVLPQRRCDSMYETANLKKVTQVMKTAKSAETIGVIKPNTSFLWSINQDKSPTSLNLNFEDWKSLYDFVDPLAEIPKLPPKPSSALPQKPPSLPPKTIKPPAAAPVHEEKIYEELNRDEDTISHSYEYCSSSEKFFTETEDGYEYCASPEKENIYETLPAAPAAPSAATSAQPPSLPKRQQTEPLPPRPPSRSSYCTIQNDSNCYESIYSKNLEVESTYESIYGGGSGSLVSSDQKSNSLYGRVGWSDDGGTIYGKATSDLSSSDRSDDWVDMTDNEDNELNSTGIIIVREKQKSKKSGWSQQLREQWSKSPRKLPVAEGVDSDTDNHYETLSNANHPLHHPDDDYDSFDSDSDSENSFSKVNLNDSGVDIANAQLPEPPNSQPYVLTRLAATAGKHMRKLRRNWSLTKNDISKSLSRMTKRKSRTDLEVAGTNNRKETSPEIIQRDEENASPGVQVAAVPASPKPYQNVEYSDTKSLSRKSFLNKFRRSMSLSADLASELTNTLENKPKSTFYLTEDIDIDSKSENETSRDSGTSVSPPPRNSKVIRPQSPPPPAPPTNKKDKRSTSWYAEVGLFKNTENNALHKKPNTFWYAEVGLYQATSIRSTPSTSSAENSGTNTNVHIKPDDFINQDNSEEYYNMKNGADYYNHSIKSVSSTETKKEQALTPDIQLRLQDEPLYQFYDAAVLESVCQDGTSSDSDLDGYEEVGTRNNFQLSSRPSAMELVSPSRNSLAFSRTLWCEIPEVIQSSVLSTLSTHQKKLQEAKFEMFTSEASYLNSLNVLNHHFIANLKKCEFEISTDELEILFGKVEAVKNCSEKLLYDLEKCWQDNILLHGVCDIIQKHAEENFDVYIEYCENQILLDDTLKKIKEKPGFVDYLRQLESSSECQSLTLYSFLLLPMQRITRWPLLVDAVLKRLSHQDDEYLTCQYTLATINKIVNQCNEGARRKERENEMRKITNQLEFAKTVPPLEICTEDRYLVRSGVVVHMQQRSDELKLTFGKRFTKVNLHLFLFSDILLITKPKSENLYTVIHYCRRNLVELNSTDMLVSLPAKEAQGRNLIFLTLLENQNEKTVEFLLSCSSESDKERWVEALTPPKSEDPNETLYECWDCPQVTAVHNYLASQPDELALSRGDVINVLRKMADGWYHGERIRDGQTGWFPANYSVEIANPHVRSRNLKQRYRLLAFSENYLKTK